jgi:hypothetical protein
VSFSANIVLAEWVEEKIPDYPDLRAGINGTGILLAHCFPELWAEFYANRKRRGP